MQVGLVPTGGRAAAGAARSLPQTASPPLTAARMHACRQHDGHADGAERAGERRAASPGLGAHVVGRRLQWSAIGRRRKAISAIRRRAAMSRPRLELELRCGLVSTALC